VVARDAIRHCGTPQELVSDNGREVVSVWEATLTKFGQLLVERGIVHRTCAPYYPQGTGKVEAFNRTLTRKLLSGRTFATLAELQAALDQYLTYYNNYRLHSALGWQSPITRYSSCAVMCRGLAGLVGLERMAANPAWGESYCDPAHRGDAHHRTARLRAYHLDTAAQRTRGLAGTVLYYSIRHIG
jgi:hypothetical protein